MGTQITITKAAMVEAGWKIEEEEIPVYGDVEQGEPEILWYKKETVFVKGDVRLKGYGIDCFHADCKPGGHNDALFMELGLYDLKHRIS